MSKIQLAPQEVWCGSWRLNEISRLCFDLNIAFEFNPKRYKVETGQYPIIFPRGIHPAHLKEIERIAAE